MILETGLFKLLRLQMLLCQLHPLSKRLHAAVSSGSFSAATTMGSLEGKISLFKGQPGVFRRWPCWTFGSTTGVFQQW